MTDDDARRAYMDRFDGIIVTEFLEPFEATLDAYRMGTFGVLVLAATARRSTRDASRIAHDRYDSIGVQYIVAGAASGDADGQPVDSLPGTVMILDYGRPFTITDHQRRDVVNVALPRANFPVKDAERWHGAVLQGPAATMLGRFMASLGETLPSLAADAGGPLAQAFMALLTLALGGGGGAGVPTSAEARLVRRAGQLIDDRIASPDLDPAWLAGKLNISRSELYSVLEQFGGVARFILRRRLARARAALEDPADGRRIGAIAYAFGFSSEASFARAFRAAFGTTASVVQQTARSQRRGE